MRLPAFIAALFGPAGRPGIGGGALEPRHPEGVAARLPGSRPPPPRPSSLLTPLGVGARPPASPHWLPGRLCGIRGKGGAPGLPWSGVAARLGGLRPRWAAGGGAPGGCEGAWEPLEGGRPPGPDGGLPACEEGLDEGGGLDAMAAAPPALAGKPCSSESIFFTMDCTCGRSRTLPAVGRPVGVRFNISPHNWRVNSE